MNHKIALVLFVSLFFNFLPKAHAEDKQISIAQSAWIGIGAYDVNEKIAEAQGLANLSGAVVDKIAKESPAEKSGVQAGDIILSINGIPINNSQDLHLFVANAKAGDQVILSLWRNKSPTEITLVLNNRGADPSPGAKMMLFANGEIKLTGGFFAALKYGRNRSNLIQFMQSKSWSILALQVINLDLGIDQAYYYLGSAAKGMGFYDAARIYYQEAISDNYKCTNGPNVCDGIDIYNQSQAALKEIQGTIGWKSYSSYQMGNLLKLDMKQISTLNSLGVTTPALYNSEKHSLETYRHRYQNMDDFTALVLFITDKKSADSQRIGLDKLLDDRDEQKKKMEAAAKLEAERKHEAQLKAEKESRAQAERDAKEMIRIVQNLSIKSVHLGTGAVPCSPKDELYTDIILHQPVRLQLECSFGTSMDKTTVIFAADGITIVSVSRRQNLTASDPLPEEIVKKAVGFYGKPSIMSSSASAYYGNLYSSDYGERNENGVGMKIKGSICFAGDVDERECKYLGAVNKVEYELVNMPLLLKSREDGKIRLANRQKLKLHEQSF